MAVNITIPLRFRRTRTLSFDEDRVRVGNRIIRYSEVNSVRMFGIDVYLNGVYMGRNWTLEIASAKTRLYFRFEGKPGSPAHEAFDRAWELSRYYILPGLVNRTVAMIQNTGSGVRVGGLALTQLGITKTTGFFWHRTLNWADFAGCDAIEGKFRIFKKNLPSPTPMKWWTASIKVKTGCFLPDVLDACYRSRVLGDSRPLEVDPNGPPRPLTATPEMAAAKIVLLARSHYEPSHGWRIIPFIGAALLSLIAAILGAILLSALYIWGLYYYIVVPLVVLVLLAFVVSYSLKWARCRNGIAAWVLGIVGALVLYIGHYDATMVYEDHGKLFRPDLLVSYIPNQIATTRVSNTGGPFESDPGSVIFFTIVESVLLLLCLPAVAMGRARAAYCDICDDWMTFEVARFPAGKTPELLLAFAQLDPQPIQGLGYEMSRIKNGPHCRVAVEYSPKFHGYEPPQVFLSVGEVAMEGMMMGVQKAKPGELFRAKFTRKEIESVLPIFKFKSR